MKNSVKFRFLVILGVVALFSLLGYSVDLTPNALSIEVNAPEKAETYQLFCDIGRGFNEVDSFSGLIHPSDKIVTISFFGVPFSQIQRLRVAPGAGCSKIKSIHIYHEFHRIGFRIPLYQWSDNRLLADFCPRHDLAEFTLNEQGMTLNSTGGDPYFEFCGNWGQLQASIVKSQRQITFGGYGLLFVGIVCILGVQHFKSLYKMVLRRIRYSASVKVVMIFKNQRLFYSGVFILTIGIIFSGHVTGLFPFGALLYLLIHLMPGIGIFLFFGDIPYSPVLCVTAIWLVSSAWNLFWSLLLLYFGRFNELSLLIIALIPLATGLLKQKGSFRLLSNLKCKGIHCSEIKVCVLIVAIFSILFMVTPKWNFLISPFMDAGNYETYSNHFWKSGTLYWDISPYLQRGVPWEWLKSQNTWILHNEQCLAKPAYLYGFPVMLGIAKTMFNSSTVSWGVNALFGVFSVVLLAFVGMRVTQNRFLGAGIALLVCLTPIYFYYSKQMMAEVPGLFGFLALIVGLSEYESERRISYLIMACSGLFLLLQVKIDSYVVPAFLLLGLGMTALTSSEYRSIAIQRRAIYIGLGIATCVSAIIVCVFENTFYLEHFSLNLLLFPNQPFIFSYGLYLLAAFCLFPFSIALYDRFLNSKRGSRSIEFSGIFYLLAFFWIVFIAWNLGVRPVGQNLTENHDAFNLIRLFTVSSPTALLLLCVCFPLVILLVEGTWQGILFALGTGLLFLLYRSHHSSPDIWWMRRYIVFLIPAMVLILAHGWRLIISSLSSVKKMTTRRLIVMLLVGSVCVQSYQLWPFLTHRVNENTPRILQDFLQNIPDEALVIMLGKNAYLRGFMNTFRSLRSGPTLLNVSRLELTTALTMFADFNNVYVISPSKVDTETASNDLNFLRDGFVFWSWRSTLKSLTDSSIPEQKMKYYLYN